MNLLIIGNGFDLDLGLPTKYSDFLDFTKALSFFDDKIDEIEEFNTKEHSIIDKKLNSLYLPHLLDKYEKSKLILENFIEVFSHKFINKVYKDFYYCVHSNCWIQYFNERYEQNLIAGENWIDLESELQNVIHAIESRQNFEIIASPNPIPQFDKKSFNIQQFMNNTLKDKIRIHDHYYKEIKILLLDDFNKFVMALGIYLDFFVSQLSIKGDKASKQLQDMMNRNLPISANIDHILSFNYINNFKIESPLNGSSNVCLVHGAANYKENLEKYVSDKMRIQDIIAENKMIVGFDDLIASDQNFELEFVDYRKYFQRIYKGTDSCYVNWLDEYLLNVDSTFAIQFAQIRLGSPKGTELYQEILQNELNRIPNRIFIFGHSLDATDNEIFKDIFFRKYNDTKITIYYHNSDARKRIITNLIRILTKPILVQKTKGTNPDINFVQQTYL